MLNDTSQLESRKHKKNNCFFLSMVGVFLLVSAVLSTAGYAYYWLYTPSNIPSELSLYTIKRGDNLTTVSRDLHSQGVMRWPKLWVAYARVFSKTKINVGEFTLRKKMSPIELLEVFQSSNFVQYSVTLVEGMTIEQAVLHLGGQAKLQKTISGDFDAASTPLPGLDYDHLEGWFFPDSYYFSAGDSDLSILLRANAKLVSVLNEEWKHRASGLPYDSPYEALIMASIIEKETGAPEERSEIAGVFIRRLSLGMKLQTDPTVIYGLEREWDGNITRADLRNPHPYNTYVNKGLPPTPIALVGREAIHAALHPSDGGSLYFVAKGDGTHYFSDTLEEHNAAVKRFQLRRKEGYRSNYQKTEPVSGAE